MTHRGSREEEEEGVCVCVCMRMCMCAHMGVCVCVCMRMCMCAHMGVLCVCAYLCVFVCLSVKSHKIFTFSMLLQQIVIGKVFDSGSYNFVLSSLCINVNSGSVSPFNGFMVYYIWPLL